MSEQQSTVLLIKVFIDPYLQPFGARLSNVKKAPVFCNWNGIFNWFVLYLLCFMLHKHRMVVFGWCFFCLWSWKKKILPKNLMMTRVFQHYPACITPCPEGPLPWLEWDEWYLTDAAAVHLRCLSLSARLLLLFPLFHSRCLYLWQPPPPHLSIPQWCQTLTPLQHNRCSSCSLPTQSGIGTGCM